MTRPLSTKRAIGATPRHESKEFYAPIMRQSPRGYVSRNVLASLVVESESEIIKRLRADGYIEDRNGRYSITSKGEEIGVQKGKQLFFHLYRTTAAIGLTAKLD